MYLLLSMFLIDYILTYIGIQNNIIVEGNPLMIWLFEINFINGFMIRIIMALIIYSLILYIKNHYKSYRQFIIFICIVYSSIIPFHLYWLINM